MNTGSTLPASVAATATDAASTNDKLASEAAVIDAARCAAARSAAMLRLGALADDEVLDEFLKTAADHLAAAVDSPSAVIYLRSTPSDEIVAICSTSTAGVDPQAFFPEGAALADGGALAAQMIATKQPVMLNDPAEIPASALEVWDGIGRVLAVPVVRRGEVVAAAVAVGKPSDYVADDADTLLILADLVIRVVEGDEARRLSTRLADDYRRAMWSVVEVLANATEVRDPYTAGHQRSVAKRCVEIGRELNLSDAQLEELHVAAALHDIGKIAIPGEILSRPGRLSEAEMALVRTHSQSGADIIASVAFPWCVHRPILEHHERLDGSGYPRGLRGDEIGLTSRILAVADVFDAMSSDRPYRPAHSVETALAELRQGAGTKYDATVVEACVRVVERRCYDAAMAMANSSTRAL